MDDTPWYETFLTAVGSKVGQFLDYKLDDELGINEPPPLGLGANPYPEQTPPNTATPVEPGFTFGNNAPTYAVGFGALLLGFVLYKAVK